MLLHGEAVSIDMALSTELAHHRGFITSAQRERVLLLMRKLQLPLWHDCCNLKLFAKVSCGEGSICRREEKKWLQLDTNDLHQCPCKCLAISR